MLRLRESRVKFYIMYSIFWKIGDHYLQFGGWSGMNGDFKGGTYFWQVASRKNFKSPRNPFFYAVQTKIILQNYFEKIFDGLKKISGPPSTIWPLREAIIYGLGEAGNSDNFREWPYFLLNFLELTYWPPRNPKQSLMFLPLHGASKIFAPPSRHVQNFFNPLRPKKVSKKTRKIVSEVVQNLPVPLLASSYFVFPKTGVKNLLQLKRSYIAAIKPPWLHNHSGYITLMHNHYITISCIRYNAE